MKILRGNPDIAYIPAMRFPLLTSCCGSIRDFRSRDHVRRHLSSKSCDPLKILFCGSDEFSIASLEALSQERKASPNLIASIDVACRPAKPVQRNLRALREGIVA